MLNTSVISANIRIFNKEILRYINILVMRVCYIAVVSVTIKHTQNTQERNFTQKCPRNKSGVYYNKQDRNGVEGNYTGGCL